MINGSPEVRLFQGKHNQPVVILFILIQLASGTQASHPYLWETGQCNLLSFLKVLPGGGKNLGGTYSETLAKPLWYFTGTH